MDAKDAAAYYLSYSDAEHERLIRQAIRLAPVSERFFREAGIGSGQHVLDVGSGVGDVAMLLAKIVGPSGKVVAIEINARSIDRARARAADAGLHNIDFVQADIDQYSADSTFDAVAGRYVLQFLPEPAATLRSVAKHVRRGGIVAFQEAWAPFRLLSAHLPLWSAAVSVLHEGGLCAGVNLELGLALRKVFQDAGLPAPHMRLEMELGCDPDIVRWTPDTVQSTLPQLAEVQYLVCRRSVISIRSRHGCKTMSRAPIGRAVDCGWSRRGLDKPA